MAILLGLDIGSNSVGSAWVDTDSRTIHMGVSVFPAGVDETEAKRGAPKGKHRREKRQGRRNLRRRAQRKATLRAALIEAGLLPADQEACAQLMARNPWHLRRDGVSRPLTPHEFGRVLVHLNQRRGALGVQTDPEDPDEGLVKESIDRLRQAMAKTGAETFGQFMADRADEWNRQIEGRKAKVVPDPIRNRRDQHEDRRFHADREAIRGEFKLLWQRQQSSAGPLAELLTDDLLARLADPQGDATWREKGVLFGQRRTYWNVGTLGRCDLEPTDRRCPLADMHAQEFRVLETVNNIRLKEPGGEFRPLNDTERGKVIEALRRQKSGSIKTVQRALGIDRRTLRKRNVPLDAFRLNLESDPDREINADWFSCEIILGVFGQDAWAAMAESQRESVNRALLKFDPQNPTDADRLRAGAAQWWNLDAQTADRFIAAWKTRASTDTRVNLSRRAIQNLMPYLRRGLTVTEARKQFAEDPDSAATDAQRERYRLDAYHLSKPERRFLGKHPDLLPPAPMLPNPVVRRAIHEVRRHVNAYVRRYGRLPDRVVVELARQARQSEKVRNAALTRNRLREKVRKVIEAKLVDWGLIDLSETQKGKAVQRVLLCRQQHGICPYSTGPDAQRIITEPMAAEGRDVEIDHIVPLSRSQDNGLNNKVLCFRNANRDKGNRTPKEWLSPERLGDLELRLRCLNKGGTDDGYFTARDGKRKWENLHRDAPTTEEFLASQLTDTAYAARQVVGWLRHALFQGERDGTRRVFTTKGQYTAMLRRDWQLQEKEGPKERTDHRHHALDAAVIALSGPEIENQVAHRAAWSAEEKARTGQWPQLPPLPPPWGQVQEFRAQVVQASQGLIVSHRPVKRRLVGYFHKDDLWGEVDKSNGVFRIRCPVSELSPKMIRMPVWETPQQAARRLRDELIRAGLADKQARARVREMQAKGQLTLRRVDPSLGKGGLVRDWNLRKIIRDCLGANEIDPDSFTDRQIKEFAKTGKLGMPSGVPIKSVIIVGPISDPVEIPVRDGVSGDQLLNTRTGKPLFRYHISRNNHHVEIREDANTGKWSGECVTMFQAARRARPPKNPDGTKPDPQPLVDRSDRDGARFVMSLCEGEMIHARRPDRPDASPDAVGYFVVVKLDGSRVYFAPHWDARPEKEQDRWDLGYPDLKDCGPAEGRPPYKVVIPLAPQDPDRPPIPLPHD